jgi:hypothetical protein
MKGWIAAVAALAAAGARGDDGELRLRRVIDAEMTAEWERQKVAPAPRCDDATFVRRVHLDLAGTIPTHDETAAFLKDADPEKRAKLVDRLLADPRYAKTQATEWDLVLFGRGNANADVRKRDGFVAWLADKFAKNEPYDRWVREILLAEGNTIDHGAPMFLAQFRGQALDTAEGVSKIFLGTQIRCARCHDHPSDRWTQLDFYGLAAFFARLAVIEAGSVNGQRKLVVAEKSTGDLMFTGPAKDAKPGQKGEPVSAKYLNGSAVPEPPVPVGFKEPDWRAMKGPAPKPLFSRKEKLAAWLTSPENPFFAKAVVNRVWAQFFSRAFHNPVDDLRLDRQVSHPALFQALEKQFVARDFDLRWLIREIVNSETYQRASVGEAVDQKGGYDRFRLRPLTAEEVVVALKVATGFEAALAANPKTPLPSAFNEYTTRYFANQSDGRGEFQGNVTERLYMNNSSQIRQLLSRKPGNLADQVLASKDPWEARVDRMFLSVLNRLPREGERARFVKYLTSGPKPDPRVEEAIWVLVNSAEFRFNH